MEKYTAIFGVHHGVSNGYGVKTPDYSEVKAYIHAMDKTASFNEAMNQAKRMSMDYLSDPNTGLTTARLLKLHNSQGGNIPFDSSKAVAKSSMLEHILSLG